MELREIIETEYRHPYYDVTQKIAEDAMMIHTQDPEKQRKELKRYRGGEEAMLMDQRVKLHNPITAAILAPVYSYQSYIWRADGTKYVHTCPDKHKKELIENNYSRFYGEKSLYSYISSAVAYYNKIDPDAYVGFDRENIEENGALKEIRIYPVEFPSNQIVLPLRDNNGLLIQLTALRMFVAKDKNGNDTTELKEYRHYYPGGWVVAYEATRDGVTHPDATEENGFEPVVYMVKKKAVTFWVKEGENGTTEVPFFCVGAYEHPEHRHHAHVTFTHDSTGIIKALLRDDNFLAVQKAVHCFPDRSEYTKPCRHVNDQGDTCSGGYYGGIQDNDHICHACKGLGHLATQTEQKVTRLLWPESATDLVELSKTKHYHERPLEIAKMYIDEINRQSELVFTTTYNQNSLKPVPYETATKSRINDELINNKLSPLGAKIEAGYELGYRIAHQFYGVTNGDVELTHPADFKVLSVDELIEQHKAAIESQLPSSVRTSIVDDILNKQYRNWPGIKADIQAFESWKPWRDKTPEETIIIVSGRGNNDFYKKLWENWEAVVNQVKFNLTPNEYEPKFYLKSRQLQQKEITKALDEVLGLAEYAEVVEPDPIEYQAA